MNCHRGLTLSTEEKSKQQDKAKQGEGSKDRKEVQPNEDQIDHASVYSKDSVDIQLVFSDDSDYHSLNDLKKKLQRSVKILLMEFPKTSRLCSLYATCWDQLLTNYYYYNHCYNYLATFIHQNIVQGLVTLNSVLANHGYSLKAVFKSLLTVSEVIIQTLEHLH
jgi:hypothetical protein